MKRLFILLFLTSFIGVCKIPENKSIPKKRILRPCCAFGLDLKLFGIPFIRVNKIISSNHIGEHKYLGGKNESNGLIYTKKAGFLDLGHIRDQADWTAYLFKLLKNNKGLSEVELPLGFELGKKVLSINIPDSTSDAHLVELASQLAFELSTWHEIASWYGATRTPVLNEKFSSFSFEDNFSNALGAEFGKQACLSPLNFNLAMDSLIENYLIKVEACTEVKETEWAITTLADAYWNPKKSLSNKKIILVRNFEVSFPQYPIVFEGESDEFVDLKVNESNFNENKIEIKYFVGYRFPFKKLFPNREERVIYSSDFRLIIEDIKTRVDKIKWQSKPKEKRKRKTT